jgi:hypothetical protein
MKPRQFPFGSGFIAELTSLKVLRPELLDLLLDSGGMWLMTLENRRSSSHPTSLQPKITLSEH